MTPQNDDDTGDGVRPAHRDTERIRLVLADLLATGRLVTTSELRTRLEEHGFCDIARETVYRQLRLLAGRGLIRRVGPIGRGRDVRWTTRDTNP